MFDEVLGAYNPEKDSLKRNIKEKLDYFFPRDIIRIEKLIYRNGSFIFSGLQHTGNTDMKRFISNELRDIFRLTGRRSITIFNLDYEEGTLIISDISWTS